MVWTNASGCTDTAEIAAGTACGCANSPTVSLSASSGSTCVTAAITVSGNTFGGSATEVTLTHDGGGTITAPTTKTSSPFSFEYTPVAGDAGNTVTITATTDNPLGAPCVEAVASYALIVNQEVALSGAETATCDPGNLTYTLTLTANGTAPYTATGTGAPGIWLGFRLDIRSDSRVNEL